MKKFLFSLTLLSTLYSKAQVGVGATTADASAALDVVSAIKGFLPPLLTQAQRTAIGSPATAGASGSGVAVYNGSNEVQKRPLALVIASAASDVATSAGNWVVVGLNAVSVNIGGHFSNNTFTAPRSAYYQVSASVVNRSNGSYNYLAFFVNNTAFAQSSNFDYSSCCSPNLLSKVVWMNAGEQFTLRFFSNSGANIAGGSGSAETYLTIHELPQ